MSRQVDISGETLSNLDLHHLPDNKAVFACQKCSQVVVRPQPMHLASKKTQMTIIRLCRTS